MKIEEQYRTVYFTQNNTVLELTINQVNNTFDFQSPGQEMIKLKGNNLDEILDTMVCLNAALDYLRNNTNIIEENLL